MTTGKKCASARWASERKNVDAVMTLDRPHASSSTWSPNTDVYENSEYFIVRLELSGVLRKDLEIRIENRVLLVRGCRHDPCRQRKCKFHQMEIEYGHFERRIPLPDFIERGIALGSFENGLLRIRFPKVVGKNARGLKVVFEEV